MLLQSSSGGLIMTDLAGLSGVFTDIIVVCEDGQLRTSRVILVSLSSWLEYLLLTTQSTEVCTLVLPQVSTLEVTALLHLATVGECRIEASTILQLESLKSRLGIDIVTVTSCKYECGASFKRYRMLKRHQSRCPNKVNCEEIITTTVHLDEDNNVDMTPDTEVHIFITNTIHLHCFIINYLTEELDPIIQAPSEILEKEWEEKKVSLTIEEVIINITISTLCEHNKLIPLLIHNNWERLPISLLM
jgi:hypothetical protein